MGSALCAALGPSVIKFLWIMATRVTFIRFARAVASGAACKGHAIVFLARQILSVKSIELWHLIAFCYVSVLEKQTTLQTNALPLATCNVPRHVIRASGSLTRARSIWRFFSK